MVFMSGQTETHGLGFLSVADSASTSGRTVEQVNGCGCMRRVGDSRGCGERYASGYACQAPWEGGGRGAAGTFRGDLHQMTAGQQPDVVQQIGDQTGHHRFASAGGACDPGNGGNWVWGTGGHRVWDGGYGRDALEGKGPQRRPQKRLEDVGGGCQNGWGGYCRLQMALSLALGVRGTVAGHRPGALDPMRLWVEGMGYMRLS